MTTETQMFAFIRNVIMEYHQRSVDIILEDSKAAKLYSTERAH